MRGLWILVGLGGACSPSPTTLPEPATGTETLLTGWIGELETRRGIAPLEAGRVGRDDRELRIWYFGAWGSGIRGTLLRFHDGRWQGLAVHGANLQVGTRDTSYTLREDPAVVWQAIAAAGLWTLPERPPQSGTRIAASDQDMVLVSYRDNQLTRRWFYDGGVDSGSPAFDHMMILADSFTRRGHE